MKIKSIEASVYRVPIDKPVRNSFGEMRNRPAVLVRAEADDGTVGWGETWCNFPTVGAEHRARLINETLTPLVCAQAWDGPPAVFDHLSTGLHILGVQAGEPGPLAQTIAGVDIALWDLAARQAGLPLFAHLIQAFGDDIYKAMPVMPCYASGLGPEAAHNQAMSAQAEGHRAFKLKVGFGDEADLTHFAAMRRALGAEVIITLDANQRWTVDEAVRKAEILAEHGPYWLEEPLPADRPADEWRDLAARCPIPLAGGENLRGPDLAAAAGDSYFRFIQPDIAKWGGFSAGYPMAKTILAAGKTYCPHYLGGGIGLVASAHLLAAAGGPGFLEVDYNPNPLRALMADPLPEISKGRCRLSNGPGLGVEPSLDDLAPYRTL